MKELRPLKNKLSIAEYFNTGRVIHLEEETMEKNAFYEGAVSLGNGAGCANRATGPRDYQLGQVDGPMQGKSARESGVLTEAERLSQTIAELETTVGYLLARIQSVVRDEPSPSVDRANTNVPEPSLCHVGMIIRDERRRLQALTGALHELTRRIDL